MNPENYKYINEARRLLQIFQDIIVNEERILTFDAFPIESQFRHRPNRPEIDWVGILVYLRGDKMVDFTGVDIRFKEIHDILHNNPSFVEAALNFIGPNSITPLHSDRGAYAYDSWAIAPTYQLVGGIYSPAGDIGLEMNGIAKKWEAGEFVAFDGSTEHHGWNRTNEWRISLYLDVVQPDFN